MIAFLAGAATALGVMAAVRAYRSLRDWLDGWTL